MINYCIVAWNVDKLRYEVVFYDKVFERVDEWYIKLQEEYPGCQLMINAFEMKKEDVKRRMEETVERLRKKKMKKGVI